MFCHFAVGRENHELNILIFDEVLLNVARVDRVLTQPGGSLLMAGISGVGRRSAVSVVAYMHHMTLYTPKTPRGYSLKSFKMDLKSVRKVTIISFLIIINFID